MNELIKKQLEQCIYANLDNYDEETNTYHIPKYTKVKYETNKMYLVKVSKEFVNNTNSVVACNWNNSTAPKYEYLKIYISKFNGKMAYIDSLAINPITKQDLTEMWSGWISIDDLTLIQEL